MHNKLLWQTGKYWGEDQYLLEIHIPLAVVDAETEQLTKGDLGIQGLC